MSLALEKVGGYELALAHTAFEAGVIARETRPHVIVIDITLPDVVPETIALRVRGTTDLEDVCLIGAATGLTKRQGQTLLQSGFQGYLSKPFDVHSLIDLIEDLSLT